MKLLSQLHQTALFSAQLHLLEKNQKTSHQQNQTQQITVISVGNGSVRIQVN